MHTSVCVYCVSYYYFGISCGNFVNTYLQLQQNVSMIQFLTLSTDCLSNCSKWLAYDCNITIDLSVTCVSFLVKSHSFWLPGIAMWQ